MKARYCVLHEQDNVPEMCDSSLGVALKDRQLSVQRINRRRKSSYQLFHNHTAPEKGEREILYHIS